MNPALDRRPEVRDVDVRKEITPLPTSTRVIVFGTRVNGAYDLAEAFQDYLNQGRVADPDVRAFKIVDHITDAFYGVILSRDEVEAGKAKPSPSLPAGVIALPEMRQYCDGWMFIKTPFDFIRALCEKHGVPFVRFDKAPTLEELQTGVNAFLPQQHQIRLGTPEQ